MHFSSFFVPAFLAVNASAHGFLAQVHIGSHKYDGNSVGNPPTDSPIRQLNDVGPNMGADNPDINCGHGAKPAALVVNAMPGDKVAFDWRDGDGKKEWPHDMGPMLAYMASCGSKPCSQFDSINAKWFKIYETGMLSDRTWKQADLQHGDTIHTAIPNTLANGNYLLRTEIIALHNADRKGGAEFYVDCVQLSVGGNKGGKPSNKDLVKFPGGYSDEDPGIWVPKIYDGLKPSDYVIPGPRIASFVNGNSDSSVDSTSANSTYEDDAVDEPSGSGQDDDDEPYGSGQQKQGDDDDEPSGSGQQKQDDDDDEPSGSGQQKQDDDDDEPSGSGQQKQHATCTRARHTSRRMSSRSSKFMRLRRTVD